MSVICSGDKGGLGERQVVQEACDPSQIRARDFNAVDPRAIE